MIVVIVVICLVVEVLNGFCYFIRIINLEVFDLEIDLFLVVILNVCIFLNFYINFWIYICLSQEFRKIL